MIALGALGCERVVDLDLEPGPVRLVVEGGVRLLKEQSDSLQTIRLTTTDQLDADREPPAARGAMVLVSDDVGHAWPLSETEPGIYRAAFGGVPGHRYHLRIDYQGERYEASDQLTPVPEIDSIYFVFEEANIAVGEAGYRAAIDYSDPADVKNYYLWEQTIDGKSSLISDPGNRFRVISVDDYYDGVTITAYQPFDEAIVEPDQEVVIRQVALSERSYRWLFALFEQTQGNEGSPFSVPPATVRGNVANLTDPAHYPLGYFLAAEVAEARAVLPPPAPAPPGEREGAGRIR